MSAVRVIVMSANLNKTYYKAVIYKDMKSARKLKDELNYTEWRNFEGVIKRAINLITHQHTNGEIIKTSLGIEIGSGVIRNVVDYKLDKIAEELITELASSYKLNNFFKTRNETVVIQLIEKYCLQRVLDFEFQYNLDKYNYDCMVDNSILVEFDEPHHQTKRQKEIDREKDLIAKQKGFAILRVNLEMNIVDIIYFIENKLFEMKKRTTNEKVTDELNGSHHKALIDCCNDLLNESEKGNTPIRQLTGLRILLNRSASK